MDHTTNLPSQNNSSSSSDDGVLEVDTTKIINNITQPVSSLNGVVSPVGGAVNSPTSSSGNRVKSPGDNQQSLIIPSLPLSGVRIASPSSISSGTSHLNITTTSSRVPNSYDLFNSSATSSSALSSTSANNSDLAISFFIPSSPSHNSSNGQVDSSRDSYSFSPQLIGSSTSNRRQKQQLGLQQQQQHLCNEQCNHNNSSSNDLRKTKGLQLGNNVWRRLQRGIRSFKRIFCSGQETEEADMPLLVIAQDMSVRIHLFSTMFLNWFKTLIVLVIGFFLNLKYLISTGGYKQLFTRKNITDNMTSLSNWIQSLQNTNPEAHWLLGNIQQFVSFFLYPLSLSSSRNYSLSFQQHQQLKTHFLFCVIILTFAILEIFIGMLQYGKTHNHESSLGSTNEEQENIVQSYRNHGFMASLLILFSGFYLLHRGFMFLIDLIVIYIKTTHDENTLQGSSNSVITKSSLSQLKTIPSSTINSFDSPLGTNSINPSSYEDSFTLEEEGAIKRLLFQPYTYSLWKRLRVLLRFANAVFSSFVSLSIFSEMIQFVLTSKFSSHDESIISETDRVPTNIDDILEQYRVGILTYLLIIFGLFINGLSIYLFGNYSGSSSYQAKKNEEDFLLLSSDKRKTPSSGSSRGNVPLNRMNSSPMWFQQFSSFNSVFNTSQTSTIGRYYNTIHNYIRDKIPSTKFWVYIIMREAHIHVALFIYLQTIYYSRAGIGFDFILCCMSTMTSVFFSLPVLKSNGKTLLQTTPENLSNQLNSCVKEVSSMVEGVLECHSEHFWALNCSSLDEADEEDIEIDADKRKQELIATIKVRVANNVQVDHQRVLQSVRKIFCSNGLLKEHNLTVQVEKNTILGLEKIYQDDNE